MKTKQSEAFLSCCLQENLSPKTDVLFFIFCFVIEEHIHAITQCIQVTKLNVLPFRGHHTSINFPKCIFAIHFTSIYDPSVSTLIKWTETLYKLKKLVSHKVENAWKLFCLKISAIMGHHCKISTAMTRKQTRIWFFLSFLHFYCHCSLTLANLVLSHKQRARKMGRQ